MTSIAGTLAALVGFALCIAALAMIGTQSPFAGTSDVEGVLVWSLVFLAGIFVFGWGLGKRATAR